MVSATEVAFLSAAELGAAFRAGALSPSEACAGYLEGSAVVDSRSRPVRPLGEAGVSRLKIVFSANLGRVEVDEEVAAAVSLAARQFEELGAIVTEIDPGVADPISCFEMIWSVGAATAVRPFTARERREMDPSLIEIAVSGAGLKAVEYLAAFETQRALSEHMEAFFSRYDLLLIPTLPIAAFRAGREVPEAWPHRGWTSWTPFTYPFNLSASPAVSVPAAFPQPGYRSVCRSSVRNTMTISSSRRRPRITRRMRSRVDGRPSRTGNQ